MKGSISLHQHSTETSVACSDEGIHVIIFSDKSGTMDLIFRDLRAFSGTSPPHPNFFFSIIGRSLYSGMLKPSVQNSKKSYYSTDDVKFLISVLLIFR